MDERGEGLSKVQGGVREGKEGGRRGTRLRDRPDKAAIGRDQTFA